MRTIVILTIVATLLAVPAWALRPNPDWNMMQDILLWHMDDPTGNMWTDTAWGSMNGTGAATTAPGLLANPSMGGLGAARGFAAGGIVSPSYASARGHEFTAECWVYWPTGTNPQANAQVLFDRRSPTNVWYAKVNTLSGGGVADTVEFAAWVAGGTGGAVNTGPCNFVNNQWYHIAITCQHIAENDNTIRIYVTPAPAPGVPITSPVLKVERTGYGDMQTTGGTPMRVGGGVTGTADRNFDGYMDEVRLSNVALTSFDSFLPGISPNTVAVAWGATQQFYYDSTATPITWEVFNESGGPGSVGSIDANGLFTALGPGTCQVRATDNASVISESGTITVLAPVVAPDTITLAPQGTQQFTFEVTQALPVTWQVVNESTPGVGTVDSNGLFTALVPGTCQVRATDNRGFTDDSDIITVANPVITPSPAQVVVGYNATFTCFPYVGTLTWQVINESGGAGSVGTIDPASGVFTGVAPGTCEVKATDGAGNTGTAPITVVSQGAYRYVPDSNTLALYHLDETTGNRIDSSVNGLNLANYSVAHVDGVYGNAIGGLDYLDTTTYRGLTTAQTGLLKGDEFTVEAWIYFPADVDIMSATASMRPIVSYRNVTNQWELVAGNYSGTYGVPGGLTFVFWGTPASEFVYTPTAVFTKNDTWYHVAVTLDKLDTEPVTYEAKLYVTELGTMTPQLVHSQITSNVIKQGNDILYIGATATTRKFPGHIDEVRVSKGVRTEEELKWTLGALSGIVATPEFTPGAGNYAIPQSVAITCATAGATIYYTTDGSEPSQSSTQYTGTLIPVDQNMTIRARAYKTGFLQSDIATGTYVFPADYNRPKMIPYSDAVTIDGYLTDWADAEWAPLDQDYSGLVATDVAEAYYAARWGENGNKLYVAVKVRDTMPVFKDDYDDWNTRDAAEFYIHTTGTGPVNYNATQEDAQQYVVGFNTAIPDPGIWSCLSAGRTYPAGAFQAAGKVILNELDPNQTWLQYEVAITPYHSFSNLQVSTLSAGQIIGLDVVVGSNNGSTFGMKSENTLIEKWQDYTRFGLHLLVGEETNIAEAKKSANGASVNVSGVVSAVFTDYFYVESTDRTYGIRVNKVNHGCAVGEAVSVNGIVGTLDSTERYIAAAVVAANGSGDIKPLGMTNKTLGGGDFGTLPNGQAGVIDGNGTNNIGLLVTTTGRVTTKDTNWFMIDDGSGVSVKVIGAVPAGTPNVSVTGISSCEKDTGGAVQRVVLATAILENAP